MTESSGNQNPHMPCQNFEFPTSWQGITSSVMGKKDKQRDILSGFTGADKEVLVTIVKAAQGQKISGIKGDWKEFLAATGKRRGATFSDPAKRPWEILASFVKTLTTPEAKEMVKRVRECHKQHNYVKLLDAEFWVDSPEQELVRMTHQHSCYKELYSFPSYSKGWVMTELGDRESSSSDRMISLDCEMVLCDHGKKELVRVCVVDHDCKTLLDMLVKPERPVVDYLTFVTGVSAVDLEGVTCTPLAAQKEVMKLLTPGTILVGHSLHNDLKALKINHVRVIDTALIFKYHNKTESYLVGLNDICKAVLGHGFREDGKPHNCLDDAIIPMRIVHHKLKLGLNEALDIQTDMQNDEQLSKLLIHSIPTPLTVNDLEGVFPREYQCEIQDITWSKAGRTYAIFRSIAEANKAFEDLQGHLSKDTHGRPQKIVDVPTMSGLAMVEKASIKVRKMLTEVENGNILERDCPSEHISRKRVRKGDHESSFKEISSEGATPCQGSYGRSYSKNRKQLEDSISESDLPSEKEDCSDEMYILRKQLRERDDEIECLQRLVVALSRKQGF
eukprot:c24260_g1_i1 orf=264-1943(+)